MRVGGGGERGVIGDFRKNILQNDFQGKNIGTEKKISWRIMLGKNLTPLYDGKNSQPNQITHTSPPPPQKSNGRLGPGKSKMADVYSVGTQVGVLFLFTT